MSPDWPLTVIALLIWGMIVGVDLVSGPQAMLARPIVTATVAGWILGDVEAGLRVGVVMEFFALDVLPVGAVRYPDFGPATVATVTAAAGAPWELSLGVNVAMGLLLALLGGWSMQWLRHANARAIQARSAALSAGEQRAIRLLQYGGLARDALRSAVLTTIGLVAATLIRTFVHPPRETAVGLTLVVLGAALASIAGGALRAAGRGPALRWLAAGFALGLVLMVLI